MITLKKNAEKLRDKSEIVPETGISFPDLFAAGRWTEPMLMLAYKNIAVRYKQSALGFIWILVSPLLTMLVLWFVFGKVAKISSEGVPYPVFALSGVVLWSLISKCIQSLTTVTVSNTQLIEKIYFPRLILPFSAAISAFFDFIVSLPILVVFLALYGIELSGKLYCMPLFVMLALLSSIGIGLWFSAINVFYRDVGHIVPFFVQTLMFLSPVAYPFSKVPEALQPIFSLNPFLSAIEGFRWTLFADYKLPGATLITLNALLALTLFFTGMIFYRTRERSFADRI